MPQINFTADNAIINRLDLEARRRSARTGKSLSRSSLVAKILDERFKGVQTLDTEAED